eukprot:3801352-Amphidinium_carterae.1
MSKISAMETKGPLAKKYFQVLNSMDSDPSNLQELLKIAEHVPDIVESLLPGASNALLDRLCQQVKTLCGVWCDGDVVVDKNDIQKVLAQACSIFQNDMELSELLDKCGARLREAGETAVVRALSKQAALVMSTAKGDIREFVAACNGWGQQLQNCRLSSVHGQDEGLQDNSKKAIENICNTVASQMSAMDAQIEEVELCLNTAAQAAQVVEAKAFTKNLKVLGSGLKLWKVMKHATSREVSAGAAPDQGLVSDCVSLQRCLQDMKKEKENTQGALPHEQALAKLVQQCEQHVKNNTKKLQDQAIEGISTCRDSLDAVAGGCANGKHWLEDWDKESKQDWQALLAYAEKTILTMDAQMLNDLIGSTEQAAGTNAFHLCCYDNKEHLVKDQKGVGHNCLLGVQHVLKVCVSLQNKFLVHEHISPKAMGFYKLVHDDLAVTSKADLYEKVTTLLNKARVTKSTGIMLHVFCHEENKAKMRALLQAELKAMRSQGLKEKDCLPQLLLDKVFLALAMRY